MAGAQQLRPSSSALPGTFTGNWIRLDPALIKDALCHEGQLCLLCHSAIPPPVEFLNFYYIQSLVFQQSGSEHHPQLCPRWCVPVYCTVPGPVQLPLEAAVSTDLPRPTSLQLFKLKCLFCGSQWLTGVFHSLFPCVVLARLFCFAYNSCS